MSTTEPRHPMAPAKKRKRWLIPLLAAGSILGLCVVGSIIAAMSGGTKNGTQEPAAVATTAAAAATTQAPAAAVTTKPAPPPPPAAKPTIEDGVWVVGEDVPAGIYKVTAAVGSDCYWSITKSGTNGSDIIDNGIPGGGLPKVTIKKGQDFETRGCGTWQKAG